MSEAAGTVELELTLGFDEPAEASAPKKRRGRRPTKAEIAEAVQKAEEIKAKRRKKAEEQPIVPQRQVVIPDRTEQIWEDMQLSVKDGFYEVVDQSQVRERGVIGIAQSAVGEKEYRIPLDSIKGLYRTQYVSDIHAADPIILAQLFMVYTSEPVTFAYINAEQFEALDKMLSSRVPRCYTYHDLADGKRGYTFNFPEFPSLKDLEEYRRSYTPVQRRQVDEQAEEAPEESEADGEPAGEAAEGDTAAD